jgi:hypothetical protein
MPITTDLAVMVDPEVMPTVQNNLTSEYPGYASFLRRARFKTGPAMNGVGINQLTSQPATRFYRGLDDAERNQERNLTRHFEQWTNAQADRVIDGTTLEETTGQTTTGLLSADSLADLPEIVRNGIIDDVALQTENARDSMGNTSGRIYHGHILATDDALRIPVTLADVFDETGNLHGLAPAGLGTWPQGHNWQRNPPNTDNSQNIHIPQIFHNNGTPRTISKDVLNGPITQMMAQVQGWWECAIDPLLFDTLASEFDAQYDIALGIGLLEFTVGGIRYRNTYVYPDAGAPTDRARFTHIGNPQTGVGASWYPCLWQPPGMQRMRPVDGGPFQMNNAIPGVRLGRPMSIPIYAQEWARHTSKADAISSPLQLKQANVCTYRWKQFEVRDLQA